VGALWLATVGAGMAVVWRYQYQPGDPARAPVEWPSTSHVARVPGRATLVMLAHPRCPCTRASLGELARLMTHVQGRLAATVLFLAPSDEPAGWERSDLWESAVAIPGVAVMRDQDGEEAGRFGVLTSGQVLVYNGSGHLLFSGGITPSRGHAGDNPGGAAIAALVNDEPAPHDAHVFGCSLITPRS
jgi:hypothetical protein